MTERPALPLPVDDPAVAEAETVYVPELPTWARTVRVEFAWTPGSTVKDAGESAVEIRLEAGLKAGLRLNVRGPQEAESLFRTVTVYAADDPSFALLLEGERVTVGFASVQGTTP